MRLTRFSRGSNNYSFADRYRQEYSDNFANAVPQTKRAPGLSGGVDAYGTGIAPNEIGTLRQGIVLKAGDRTGMTALQDALNAIAEYGAGVLWAQPSDPSDPERFCIARINSISDPQRLQDHDELWLRVTVIWQVPDPRWYGPGTEALPDLATYSPTGWPGTAQSDACSGTSTALATMTNNGNSIALPRFTITTGGAQTALNIKIQRLDGSDVLDEIAIQGEMRTDDEITVDCQKAQVLLSGDVDGYHRLSALHPDWMRFLPGDNDLQVVMDQAGDACTVETRWHDVYH